MEGDNEKFLIYANFARDLCQYGHVDNFCLHNIVICRSGLKGLLSEEDVETFNKYLERKHRNQKFIIRKDIKGN